MKRVTGFVIKDTVVYTVEELPFSGRPHVYVEETPSDAVRVEDTVLGTTNDFAQKQGMIYLSPHLIGKKVGGLLWEVKE